MTELVGPALALGFLGSAHCAVMCGPLATGACTGCTSRVRAFSSYQLGRLFSYVFLGVVLGAAGARVTRVVPLAPLQTALALAVAVSAFVRGARSIAASLRARAPVRAGDPAHARDAAPGHARTKRHQPLARVIAALLPRRGVGLGLATGVLPCGLLASAWALAAASGSAAGGALVMLVFGLATAPALALAVAAAHSVRRVTRSPALAGVAWCLLGLWLALRPVLLTTGHCH